jgi:Glycosyl hydrolases family 39
MRPRLLTLFLLTVVAAFAQETTLTIDLAKKGAPLNIDHFALGQGGLSDDSIWGDRIPEIRALHPRLIRLFIQEYFDLMPAPDRYNWTKLDAAVDTIRATGATPLMNIAFKPHALFPKVDDTITDPTNYDVWEKLVSAMVAHYKTRSSEVMYWEIANEPDIGERGGCPYKFTPEGYVRYYAHTAHAIRMADPEAKVGGPALANPDSEILPALLAACQSDHLPLDFVSWHIYNNDPAAIRATIDRKHEQLRAFTSLHPETILDEWNMSLRNTEVDPRFQPAFIAETAWQMFDGGLDYSCYYHIRDYHVRLDQFSPFMSHRGAVDMAWWWNRKPQYDGLFDYQNHVRPAYFTFLLLARLTGQRLDVTSSDKRVHGFATWDPDLGKYSVLGWNYSPGTLQAKIMLNGSDVELTAAPEKLDALAPSDDENIRVKPLPEIPLAAHQAEYDVAFEPYGILFWELTPKTAGKP